MSTSSSQAQAPTRDASAILAQAREALGGEKRLSAVKNFVATGRTRQVRGDNLVPIEFEIFVELPDKYLRKDEIPLKRADRRPQASTARIASVAGRRRAAAPPGWRTAAARLRMPAFSKPQESPCDAVKQDFARLTLGMFAASFSTYPLTFTYVGEAEAPQGKADVIDAKGPNNFTLRLFINQQNHLPIMVSWQGPAPGRGRGPGGPGMPGGAPPGAGRGAAPAGAPGERGAPPAGAAPAGQGGTPPAGERGAPPAGERGAPAPAPTGAGGAAAPTGERGAAAPAGERGAAPAGDRGAAPGGRGMPPGGGPAGTPPPENRLYFADYRDVDGMQFPFRLRRAVGPDTVEETTFDRFKSTPRSTRNDSRSENNGTLDIDPGNSS